MKLFRRYIAPLLILSLLLAASCSPVQEEKTFEAVNNQINGMPVLHTFGWSFNEIAANMADIAAAGFGAIQTSPISECITTAAGAGTGMEISGKGNGVWWFHYQPVSFQIGNYQLGTEAEFESMCNVAAGYNIKVIVDVVANHFCGAENSAQLSDEVRNFPGGAYREQNVTGGTNRYRETQGRLLSLLDTNTQNPHVQQEYLKYLKRCIQLGASGFRYDAALHIELPEDDSSFASDFWPVILNNGAEFQYGEILTRSSAETYVKYIPAVTDATYGTAIVSAVRNGRFDVSSLNRYRVNTLAKNLVTWVESHDTYYNDHVTANLTEKQILYGWAILCARDGSTPLFFNRPDGNTPGNVWGNNVIGKKGDDFFKSSEISALNHFKKAMEGTDELFSNPIEGDAQLLMIQRGNAGAVLINSGEQVTLNNADADNLADGVYTDLISGSEFTVQNGKISGTVNAQSVAVFFN